MIEARSCAVPRQRCPVSGLSLGRCSENQSFKTSRMVRATGRIVRAQQHCRGDREELNVIVPSKVSTAGGVQNSSTPSKTRGKSWLGPAPTKLLRFIETSACYCRAVRRHLRAPSRSSTCPAAKLARHGCP